MEKKNIVSKGNVDLTAFYVDDIPNDDIRRLIKKIVVSNINMDSIAIAKDVIDYESVKPSTLSIPSCLRLINEYKTNVLAKGHPVNFIDTLRANNDLIFSDHSVGVVEIIKKDKAKEPEKAEKLEPEKVEEKKQEDPIVLTVDKAPKKKYEFPEADLTMTNQYVSKLGFIAEENVQMMLACAVDAVLFYTREDGNGSIESAYQNKKQIEALRIVDYDLTRQRAAYSSGKSSVTMSQQIIFNTIMQRKGFSIHYIDQVYSVCKNYSAKSEGHAKLVDVVNEIIHKNRTIKPPPSEGRYPASYTLDYDNIREETQENVAMLWLTIVLSNLRGNDKPGHGATSVGYYNFSMPPSYVRAIARAREIMGLCKMLGVTIVRLPAAKEFSELLIAILTGNGISIISDQGKGTYRESSVTGHYGSADSIYLEIRKNKHEQPQLKKEVGLTQATKDFKSIFEGTFHQRVRDHYTASIYYMTDELINAVDKAKYFYFPTLSPHAGKIWVVNDPVLGAERRSWRQHTVRMFRAVCSRNLFVLTRRPFVNDDDMATFFPQKILIPKTREKKKDKDFDYDLGLRGLTTTFLNKCELSKDDITRLTVADVIVNVKAQIRATILMKYESDKDLEYEFDLVYNNQQDYLEVMADLKREGHPVTLRYQGYKDKRDSKPDNDKWDFTDGDWPSNQPDKTAQNEATTDENAYLDNLLNDLDKGYVTKELSGNDNKDKKKKQ